MGMQIPTGDQIARMTDGERAALTGWLATEKAYEVQRAKNARTLATTRRREADLADAEAEAAGARSKQLDEASAYVAGAKKPEAG